MATSSVIMLSNISMERLYLSQPPAWSDLQRLPFSLNQQQQENRSSQQMIRTCYDKLLHHMYDMNSSSSTTINQINEQLELAAEYCQLKNFPDGNAVYLHSDQFYVEIKFDPITNLPQHVSICFTDEQNANSESFVCSRMLKALNEKQYKLFREHLNGFASLFTLSAPTMNKDKRIGYTAYKILQQDLEHLSKTDMYGKLLEGFEPTCEGLLMRIKFNDQLKTDSLVPINVRIIIVPSNNQYHLPVKSSIYMDEKTNMIQLDASLKLSLPATGHFALEFDENQSPFTFLLLYAQEISQLTNINNFISNVKTFNYLATVLPKTKSFNHYHWYISHDQPAISIRRIPFTNLEQLIHILSLIRQQIYLTKYLNYYFHHDYDNDYMEDDNSNEIYLELSFLSATILSITCAQSYHLSTFLLQMSNINRLPLLINRQLDKEIYLTDEKCSLLKLIEIHLKEDNPHKDLFESNMDFKSADQSREESLHLTNPPKLNRRLSCGPPAKPAWRRATTLRRAQPPCLTLSISEQTQEKIDDEEIVDHNINSHRTTEHCDVDDEDDAFLQLSDQQSLQQQILPKPSSNPFSSSLSRCPSVSSTQSTSTPSIFGLSPSTPYPIGKNTPNGKTFFPIGRQVSVPDYSQAGSPLLMGSLDPLAFLPTNTALTNPITTNDPNNKMQKKKRRRSDPSPDDFIQTLHSTSNDNPSSMMTPKLSTSGGDPSSVKRGKKPIDKSQQQQQLTKPRSGFKVTDPPTTGLLSQQSLTSSDESPNELKPLKVVIKRVGDSGNTPTDESQQQAMKQRKKQQQPHLGNAPSGSLSTTMRKLPSNSSGGSSPSVIMKSETLDSSQLNIDSSSNTMMTLNDGTQMSRERQRPPLPQSISLSSAAASQSRSTAPQPPIVLKIQRSKVYSGQDASVPSSSSSLSTATAVTIPTTTSTMQSSLKETPKPRVRSVTSGTNTNKQHVASPPLLASKLASSSTGTTNNPLPSPSVTSLFRIPRKSSSQEVAAKPKTDPTTPNNSPSPILSKAPLLPTPGVRPSPPPPQIGSWQSPPTQQPSRFNQHRPRSSWSQQQVPRGRAPVTPPSVSILNSSHSSLPNFAQQPRSILKKPSSNDNQTSDLLYMSSSELPGLNEQRAGTNFSAPPPPTTSRACTSPGMYDDNDDDSSPQAQLVIDTSSNMTNNPRLPYTIVSGSNSSAPMDNFDQQYENNAMMNSSQQQHMGDDSLSNID